MNYAAIALSILSTQCAQVIFDNNEEIRKNEIIRKESENISENISNFYNFRNFENPKKFENSDHKNIDFNNLKKNEKWGEIIIQMLFEKICLVEDKSKGAFKALENENQILRNALQVR